MIALETNIDCMVSLVIAGCVKSEGTESKLDVLLLICYTINNNRASIKMKGMCVQIVVVFNCLFVCFLCCFCGEGEHFVYEHSE